MSMVVYLAAAAALLVCTVALILHYTRAGPAGPAGDKGAAGKDGTSAKGPKGDAGPKGKQGPKGPRGEQGQPGANGSYTASSGVYQPSATLRFSPAAADTDISAILETQPQTSSYNLILSPAKLKDKRTFSLSRKAFMTEGYMFTICNASDEDFYVVPPTASAAGSAVSGAWDNPPDCSLLKYAAIPPRATVSPGRCIMALVTKGTACPSNSVCDSAGTRSCNARTFWYLNFVTSENTLERKCNVYGTAASSSPIPCP